MYCFYVNVYSMDVVEERERERERDQTTVPIDSCLNLFHMFFYIDSHVNIL